ncbi:hypothetical protein K438DRAFT_1764598 [Mycena galopus ATCC 62051]|nr:hypothetical protein K438DRAFT_1764598 [Mycena galopus ATCC 62051]
MASDTEDLDLESGEPGAGGEETRSKHKVAGPGSLIREAGNAAAAANLNLGGARRRHLGRGRAMAQSWPLFVTLTIAPRERGARHRRWYGVRAWALVPGFLWEEWIILGMDSMVHKEHRKQ